MLQMDIAKNLWVGVLALASVLVQRGRGRGAPRRAKGGKRLGGAFKRLGGARAGERMAKGV